MIKKFLLILGMALISFGAFAQKGDIELGLKLNYGVDKPNFGYGLVGRYNIDHHFRPELTLNNYPESGDVSRIDVSANLHYLFNMTDRFKLYPLGGLGVIGYYDSRYIPEFNATRLGVNMGGGLQLNFTRELYLNAESYYQFVSDFGQIVMNVSLVYVF